MGFKARGVACNFCRHCMVLRYWRAISSVAHEFVALFLHQFVGKDGFGDLHHVARRDDVARHILAHADDFLHRQRRAGQRFQDRVLAALDAARDFHFAFAGEQRDGAHFAQIHAHRVVDLLADAGGQFEVEDFLALFQLLIEILGLFQDFDAGHIEAGQNVLELGAATEVAGQNFADFVVQDVALLFAHLYEPLQSLELIFQRH